MAIKLNPSNLGLFPPAVRVPAYQRGDVRQSIVHIGVGGFHRAHQAVYLDDLLHLPGHSPWGICGVGLLRQDDRMRDALLPQDCLYTVVESDATGDRVRVIGSLLNYLYAPDDPQAVIEKMASSECRIVSLTITEGGYYLQQGTGEFEDSHPDIVRDLAHPHEPACSFGYLAEALDRRRRRGIAPFTVMSCDNLLHNGAVARQMLLAFAERWEPALSRWIAEYCAFPSSMVDRITPGTTEGDRTKLRQNFGVDDAWPVVCEPFRQWVIEDHFPGGRPSWEQVGAQMTEDVHPYEKMKIRLLNASHQAMCYIGILLGYSYTDEAMADAHIARLVRSLMDVEVTPLLPDVPGINLGQYKKNLIDRFANPSIKDQLSRIAVDGSARIPKFILPSIAEQLDRGGPIRILSFIVASWFRYLAGTDDGGRELTIVDPLANPLGELSRRGKADPRLLLAVRELFGQQLAGAPVFREEVSRALRGFYEKGARATLAEYVEFPVKLA